MKIMKFFKYSGFAIFLLLCLTLFTLSQVSDASSRYKSDVSGQSSVSTAKWNVAVAPVTQTNTFTTIAGNTAPIDYTVRVTSTSEVSTNYAIVITNIPNGVKVSLDDGAEQTPTDNTVTFSNVGSFNIGDAINYRDHKITFNMPIESSAVNNNNINIQAVFSQKE